MKVPRSQWMLAPILAVLLAVLSGGCIQPDRWGVFQKTFEPPPPAEDTRPVIVTEEVRPRLAEEPPFALPDDGPVALSVEQASMLVLRNNRDLQVRQINPVIAGTFEQIERGAYDPELFARLEYGKEKTKETAVSTGTEFNVEGNETSVVAGIRQAFPTGTGVEATIEQGRTISDRTPELQTARLGLSITQSLLRGFGPAVNLVSVRQAELDTVASVYELRGFTEALLAGTEIAYWNYVLARLQINIVERSLAVARQQRDEIELRIEVGILPEIEAAAARAQVAGQEQALIDARSLLEENRIRLLRLISPGSHGQLDLRINATSEPAIDPEPITDLTDRLQLAEQSRPDLNEARLRLEQSRLETIVTRNGVLPRLDLFIALGQTGFADTFSDSFREVDGNTYDFRVGIRLSQFLGNRTAEAQDLAARASQRQAAEAVDNLRQIVQVDVRLAVNEVERSRQQISATKVTRTLREETLKAEKERFDVGASTALLVAQTQRDLLISSIEEVRAIVSYRTALVRLYLAEGSLLERRGVRIPAGETRDRL
ncbi:MAG: TolC family protein [Candidatus Deferrimicrobiaceae bacterium]